VARIAKNPITAVRQPVNRSTPTGWVQIGTPKKLLYVIFDTGSDKLVAKTWDTVANELASVDQGVDGMVLPSGIIYDHNASSTYHRRFTLNPHSKKLVPDRSAITYGSGTAITDVGSDTIFVGERSLTNFTLMEITKDNLELLHTSKGIAGILGLQHMKNRSLGHSLFSRLRDEGKMTSFGYCRGTGNNGTFIWGDTATEGKAVDVVGEMHWAVKLGDVKIISKKSSLMALHTNEMPFEDDGNDQGGDMGSQDMDDSAASASSADADQQDQDDDAHELDNLCPSLGCTGILDTGSNIIAGPKKAMDGIVKTLKVEPDCSNFDKLPPLSMNFGGQSVVVQPHGYIMKVPMPEHGFGDEEGSGEGGAEGDDSEHGALRTVNEHDHDAGSEAGLAQKQASTLRSATQRWKAAAQRLNKNYGVDITDMLDDMLEKMKQKELEPKFMCMPALVPLDKKTAFGPLWIVGTPLLDSYYARWSFGKKDKDPQIHIQALQSAKVCKEPGTNKTSLMRSHKDSGKHDKHAKHRHFHKRAITVRALEDIAYPHWAKSLLKV
jgi:hypothetical protein